MKALALADGAALAAGLRGLPLLDPTELEGDDDFVWTVRSFVTLPLTTLGTLATIAAWTMGNFVAAVLAGGITVLILLSLYHDTQLSKAVEQLRRGELAAAEASLRRVVDASHRSLPQRQRACAYLAAIAWLRGDLEHALAWTRAWLQRARASDRVASDHELHLTAASEVQLLALLGEHAEAAAAFERLPERPRGDRHALADANCRLLLAFCRGDAEPVRPSLEAWGELAQRLDDHGLVTALLAWAHDALGTSDRAVAFVHRARALTQNTPLRRQAPALAQWLASYDDAALRYR